ncbi:MAG: helix-turn-helix transcriptional regulator [Erysipelotrichaceae bacterium]|nr:helix-turn-helix transcriptional regulator [Erysipelotrichaceae bacterium]MBQ2214199.1 helix-turn-helix transcriptional regulator [Erysipelotrichaceae bacterium]MBR2792207.1 helix-turn-helix transcriptional regulator [Erysipelotrichaceae bacterium]
MLDSRKVAAKLRQLRVNKNLTQDNVAESVFVSRQAVSSWEKGDSLPSITSCILLLELYDTSLEELLCLNEKIEPDGDMFEKHDRSFIISQIVRGELKVDLGEVMYRLSLEERSRIVRSIRNGNSAYEVEDVLPYCNREERLLLTKGDDEDEL